jgi:hypothetical protein
MSKRTLIKNGTIITVDPAIGDLAKGDLLVEDGRIAQVAPQIDAGADAEVIDASDRLVLPGMVDTHRHTWQALFRNIGSDWTLAHYLSGLPRHGQWSLPGRRHLRRQSSRRPGSSRFRHHDAARLVPQSQLARAYGRGDRRALYVRRARRIRARRRPSSLAAAERP